MTIAVRIIPDGDEIQYVRYELDWLLKLLRLSQEWLQLFLYGKACAYGAAHNKRPNDLHLSGALPYKS